MRREEASVAWIVLVVLILMLGPAWSCNECHSVCAGQKAKGNYTFTQGCFCEDEDGLYNPKDQRN